MIIWTQIYRELPEGDKDVLGVNVLEYKGESLTRKNIARRNGWALDSDRKIAYRVTDGDSTKSEGIV